MIDLGVIDNYISLEAIEWIQLYTIKKKEPYELALIDSKAKRDNDGMVITETLVFTMSIREHIERTRLDVTYLGNYEIILYIPWIKKHNPIINWVNGMISFDRYKCYTLWNYREICTTSYEEEDHTATRLTLAKVLV